jgi:hypothetical protein
MSDKFYNKFKINIANAAVHNKIQKLLNEGKNQDACYLIKEALSKGLDFQGFEVYYAHILICNCDWEEISSLLPRETNFLLTSGWIQSISQGKPSNANNEPVPWLTYPAIDFLDSIIDSDWSVFEWGSGNSTLWWSKRVRQVQTIESDLNWFQEVQTRLPDNAQISHYKSEEEYSKSIHKFDDNCFDVIVIDGDFRNKCAQECINKLKKDGIIVFDNTDGMEFNEGVLFLQSNEFYRIDFWGMIPSYLYKNCTSIFSKNLNVLRCNSLPSQHTSSVGISYYQAMNKNATNNFIDLKPQTSVNYPPFKNGLYMEEYFSLYWEHIDFPEKDRLVYLDIFWHNLFQNAGGNAIAVMQDLTPLVLKKCEEARQEGKLVFTLFQWDDGLLLQADKPENLILFAIGSNRENDSCVTLPLIVEDKKNRLLNVPKLSINHKNVLCSFVGTITHNVRMRMYEVLKDVDGFEFHVKSSWCIDVPEDLAQKFIDVSQSSRFGLAPRGYGPSSFRFFELMQLGIIPIYVHDHENGLPYTDELDYSKFSVIIHIDDIQNLPHILNQISDEDYQQMLQEMNSVFYWFTPQGVSEYVQQYITDVLYYNDLSNLTTI